MIKPKNNILTSKNNMINSIFKKYLLKNNQIKFNQIINSKTIITLNYKNLMTDMKNNLDSFQKNNNNIKIKFKIQKISSLI